MGSDMAQVSTEEVPGTGSALAAKGAYVLKLNVAGSGDKAWRKYDEKEQATLVGDVWRSTVGKRDESAKDEHMSRKYGEKYNDENSEYEYVFVRRKDLSPPTTPEEDNDEESKDVSSDKKDEKYAFRNETISVAGPLGWGDLAILVATQFKTM